MKLALTLLVRDEVDILEAHLAFHLNAGVDVVIATDHRSTDGTAELLHAYEREGYVHLIRRDDERIRQSEWVTHMAQLAATELKADWVIHSDADEFWWPREVSLKEVLAAVPEGYGIVRAVSRVFIPRPGDGWFADRMTARLALPAPINDPATPFRHVAKAAHRAHPHAVVLQGNHDVTGLPYAELSAWSPIELLHFPLRSAEQAARKHETTWTAWLRNLRGDLARAKSAFEAGRPEAFWDRVAVDDATVRRGLVAGSLVEDLRLRDALGELRGGNGSFRRPGSEGGPLLFGPRSFADDASRAVDRVLLDEADGVRLQRRADELAARIAGRGAGAVYGYARS
jgi:glycosyl transferase family 2